jgi:hypothetical protein
MTIEEAMKIAGVCSTADGGCPVCVEGMRDTLQLAFPEFVWSIAEEDTEITVYPAAPQENQLTDWELQKRKPQ